MPLLRQETSIFFLKISLLILQRVRERERAHELQGQREREISSRLLTEHRAQRGAWSHHPDIMT